MLSTLLEKYRGVLGANQYVPLLSAGDCLISTVIAIWLASSIIYRFVVSRKRVRYHGREAIARAEMCQTPMAPILDLGAESTLLHAQNDGLNRQLSASTTRRG